MVLILGNSSRSSRWHQVSKSDERYHWNLVSLNFMQQGSKVNDESLGTCLVFNTISSLLLLTMMKSRNILLFVTKYVDGKFTVLIFTENFPTSATSVHVKQQFTH